MTTPEANLLPVTQEDHNAVSSVFQPGDKVRRTSRPDWGVGTVEVIGGDQQLVHCWFEGFGQGGFQFGCLPSSLEFARPQEAPASASDLVVKLRERARNKREDGQGFDAHCLDHAADALASLTTDRDYYAGLYADRCCQLLAKDAEIAEMTRNMIALHDEATAEIARLERVVVEAVEIAREAAGITYESGKPYPLAVRARAFLASKEDSSNG